MRLVRKALPGMPEERFYFELNKIEMCLRISCYELL